MINQNSKIKAMIMAAGVGSRLDPLTKEVPKPLIPIFNVPVMDILMNKLSNIGIKDVIANTYYLGNQISQRYEGQNQFGINFQSVQEKELSGTAGGFKKCQFFFAEDDTIVVLSGDGLTNADIAHGIEIHKNSDAIATIGIKEIPKNEVSHFGVVVTDNEGFITEFQEKPSVAEAKSSYINTGIYIFDHKIFDYIPENTFYDFAKNVFPKLLSERQINTFEISEYWSDIGTLKQYKQSIVDIFNGACELAIDNARAICSEVENVCIKGYSTIGYGCSFGKNVIIEDSIIWDNVQIEDNVTIKNSVIGNNTRVCQNLTDEIIGANENITKDRVEV